MAENNLAAAILRAWMHRGWFACLAWPISLIFGVLLRVRGLLYRFGILKQESLPVPVIVVGNIFVGGTGKTPFTMWLLAQLKQAGFKPGVISRGYGAERTEPEIVRPNSLAQQVGDEPILIAQQSACPVVVSRNRAAAGRALLAAFPDVNIIIADDGLQHLALARDVEITLFDSRGVGNGWLFPAGPLREPASRRRDLTVANLNPGELISADLPSDTVRMQLNGSRAYQLIDPKQVRELAQLPPTLLITAAAGIGNPERFFAMLRQYGLTITALPLPDHFDYAINPFANITADMILITEKDAVKCRQLHDLSSDPRLWVVAAEAQIDPAAFDRILKKLTER